jgi:hypothetical protein
MLGADEQLTETVSHKQNSIIRWHLTKHHQLSNRRVELVALWHVFSYHSSRNSVSHFRSVLTDPIRLSVWSGEHSPEAGSYPFNRTHRIRPGHARHPQPMRPLAFRISSMPHAARGGRHGRFFILKAFLLLQAADFAMLSASAARTTSPCRSPTACQLDL